MCEFKHRQTTGQDTAISVANTIVGGTAATPYSMVYPKNILSSYKKLKILSHRLSMLTLRKTAFPFGPVPHMVQG